MVTDETSCLDKRKFKERKYGNVEFSEGFRNRIRAALDTNTTKIAGKATKDVEMRK